MTEQVNFTGVYDTAMGHIVTVESDRVFRVGQIVENDGKRYKIKGFPITNNALPGVVDMVVTEVHD